MGLRKLERSVVKNNIEKDNRSIKKCFSNDWSAFREKKYVIKDSDGNVVSDMTPNNTMKKKQIHFDNKEQYIKLFNYMDSIGNEKDMEGEGDDTEAKD